MAVTVGSRLPGGRVYNPRPLAQRITSMRSKPAAPAAAAPAPAPQPQPAQPLPPNPVASSAEREFYSNSLFPSLRSTGGPTESPMYKWRLEQGIRDLDRMMAAKGHGTGADSSYAAEQRQNLVSRLTAEEASRMEDARSREADRLQMMLESEAGRRENRDFRGRDDLFRLLDMSFSQYQPGQVPQSVQDWMQLESALGNANAMMAGGGGGGGSGGGSGAMPFIPAFPSGPNTSISSQASALADASNAAGRGNLFSSILNYIMK